MEALKSCIKFLKKDDFVNFKINVKKLENINITDSLKQNITWYSLLYGKIDYLEYCISLGGIFQKNIHEQTILISAAEYNFDKIVDLCLSFEFNPDEYDLYGYTALHYAIYNRNYKSVKLLLDHNCRLDIKNSDGHTAIEFFVINYKSQFSDNHNDINIIKILKKYHKTIDYDRLKLLGEQYNTQDLVHLFLWTSFST